MCPLSPGEERKQILWMYAILELFLFLCRKIDMKKKSKGQKYQVWEELSNVYYHSEKDGS